MEFTEKQKKRLLQLVEVLDKGDLALLKNFMEVEEKVDEANSKADKAVSLAEETKKTEIVGPKGNKGDRGDKGERGDSITGPQGERGEKGPKGDSIVGPKGDKGDTGESIVGPEGKEGSPDTPEQVIEKINGAEGLIKKERVEGLDEIEKRVNKRIDSIPRGVGNRSYGASVKFHDLSSKTDGTTKTFTVPKNISGIVIGSDFPTILMENNGFTLNSTRTTLTLTTTNAPSSGSQLLFQYSSLFN